MLFCFLLVCKINWIDWYFGFKLEFFGYNVGIEFCIGVFCRFWIVWIFL